MQFTCLAVGHRYRRQIEEDTNAIVADLNARMGSLGATLRYSKHRWRSKGDGMRGVKCVRCTLHPADTVTLSHCVALHAPLAVAVRSLVSNFDTSK